MQCSPAGGFSVTVHDPAIASVSPSSGKQGEVLDVAIAGVNLDGTTGVSFGDGITVNSFAEQSAESVVASITIGVSASLGMRDIAVSTVDGTAVLPNAFSVTAPLPTIADVSPRSGQDWSDAQSVDHGCQSGQRPQCQSRYGHSR